MTDAELRAMADAVDALLTICGSADRIRTHLIDLGWEREVAQQVAAAFLTAHLTNVSPPK